eukprot:TRINITY_DN31745_c0_g1_i1.p1 TRINITY_DN31745_c0_g1~~TRINITY_DN31745_c0_g1_i1.p1  ORF type:complete len:119 (+),score=22.26 TRINITY_DN31745_c0_g1_i1:34-390(+)
MAGLVGYLVGYRSPQPKAKLLQYQSQYPSENFSSIPELNVKNRAVSPATKVIHLQAIRNVSGGGGANPSLSTMLPRHASPAGFPGMNVTPNSTIGIHIKDQLQPGRKGAYGQGRLLTR